MANTLIALKRSGTISATPSSLEFGELAINYADGILYYKNATSEIVAFTPGGGNYFGTINANSTLVVADTTDDILTLIPGDGINITGDAGTDSITLSGYVNTSINYTWTGIHAFSSNVSIDTDTFFVDTIGNKVGIGTATPEYTLDVNGTVNAAALLVNGSPVGAGDAAAAFNQANTAYTVANSAYGQANIATTNAGLAFDKANTANTNAVSAYGQANTATTNAGLAFDKANTAGTDAINAYNQANTATTDAGLAFDQANTAGIDAINAYGTANAAFNKANTGLANTSGVTFDGNLTISGYANTDNLVVSKFIDITPTASQEYKEGRLYYSTEEKTWIGYGDYVDFEQTLGEREWVRCRNSTANTILKGKAVYVTGVHIPGHPYHGHHPTVELADASDVNKKDVIGITGHDILSGDHGYVVVRGYIEGINTASLASGTRVHLGYNGDIVNDAPEYPNWPMDLGICLTSNTTNGTMYVTISDHSMERLRVQNSARVGGDLTIEGDLTILGAENKVTVNSLQVGTQFVYLGAGDSIPTANIYFTGSGLNDLVFTGHYEGSGTTDFYVQISDVSPDKYSWSYLSDFSVLEQQNVVMQYQTSQLLSNGISVYFNANTGHTVGDSWNATAYGISTDFGFVGNHIDGPNGYTHAGMFRDATDGTFKFFHSYDPEVQGNIDIANNTFAYANVQVEKITATEVYEGATKLSTLIGSSYNQANTATTNAGLAFDKANTAGTDAINAYGQANSAYGQANTATTDAGLAFDTANNAEIIAIAAFDQANTGGSGNVVITTAIIKDLTSNDVVVTNVQSANSYGTLIDPTLFAIYANSTITLAPGEQASVTNSGNTREAKFDFSIPRGNTGPAGPKSLTISYPTASEDVTILYTEAEHILSRVSSVLVGTGGSTVSFTLRYASDRSSAGTEVKTGGLTCGSTSTANNETVFDSATVPANNFIWLETSSITGSVQEFHVSLTF